MLTAALMSRPRPLEGIRVLDLSRDLAAPFSTMILGDLGADVIKIENPDGGDETRIWGPPFLKGESGYFLSTNRNKRSVTVNLKKPEGLKLIRKIIARSDVLVENFRPEVVRALHLDYASVKRLNPKIVYCSMTGFGQNGPYRDRVGYDLMIQGMGGFMGITGEAGRPPVRVGVAISDLASGLYAALAITSAMLKREKTGSGEFVDIALLDSTISLMTYMATYFFITGRQPKLMGSAHPSIVPYQAFKGSDGKYFIVAVTNNKFFEKLCASIGKPKLSKDPRFAENSDRVRHRKSLLGMLDTVFQTDKRNKWVERLIIAGVPCAPLNTFRELFDDPQVLARKILVNVRHHTIGSVKQIASPMRFKNSKSDIRLPPPTLGEHTAEVLKQLGYGPKHIRKLKQEGII
jgi:crotonobetainyl-CoA:carnitine CoA-transferase CaiB-like acyl-CoA transferase